MRQYTMTIYGVFQMRLQEAPACTCDAAHIVNLRLQSIIDKQGRAAGAVRFKVTFSYDLKNAMVSRTPWDFNGSGFRPIEAEKPTVPAVKLQPAPVIKPHQPKQQVKKKFGSKVGSIFSSDNQPAVRTTSTKHTFKSGQHLA